MVDLRVGGRAGVAVGRCLAGFRADGLDREQALELADGLSGGKVGEQRNDGYTAANQTVA